MTAAHAHVLSPTLDAALVENAWWLVTELRRDGHPIGTVAAIAAEYLQDAVDAYSYDPTDAELATSWNGPDAAEVHRAAWRLHQDLHDRTAP